MAQGLKAAGTVLWGVTGQECPSARSPSLQPSELGESPLCGRSADMYNVKLNMIITLCALPACNALAMLKSMHVVYTLLGCTLISAANALMAWHSDRTCPW